MYIHTLNKNEKKKKKQFMYKNVFPLFGGLNEFYFCNFTEILFNIWT